MTEIASTKWQKFLPLSARNPFTKMTEIASTK